MSHITFGVSLGTSTQRNESGFIAERNVFCAFEVRTASASDDLKALIHEMRSALSYPDFPTFAEFKHYIESHTRTYATEEISFACCYTGHTNAWIITQSATAHLKRHGRLYTISQGSQQKQGVLLPDDTVILMTEAVKEQQASLAELFLQEQAPKELSDLVTQHIQEAQLSGSCLIVHYEQDDTMTTAPVTSTSPSLPRPPFTLPMGMIARITAGTIVLAIIGLGGWFIIERVQEAQNKKTYETIATTSKKLAQLPGQLIENPKESADVLEQIGADISALEKKSLSPENERAVRALSHDYRQIRDTVGSMEMTADEPFFDMRLISAHAAASKMSMAGDQLVIIDEKNNKLYAISATDKSVEQFTPAKDTKPILATAVNDTVVYADRNKGLVQSKSSGSFTNIVKKIQLWKQPVALTSYGSNIYLLDEGADELFKYTPIEGGYSDALSYIQSGSSIDLNGAKSVAIDFSVYLLTASGLFKFEGGNRVDFALPESVEPATLVGAFTNADNDYLYLLAPARSRIIVLDKEGKLYKSIFNRRLKDVRYFCVLDDTTILVLYKNSVLALDNSQ